MQVVIDDEKAIVGELQTERISDRQTVEKMKEVEERIRHALEVSKRNSDLQLLKHEEAELRRAIQYSRIQEMEQRNTNEAANLEGRKDYYAQLEEQVPRLQQERKALEKIVEQFAADHKERDSRIAELEEKMKEAERLRTESEGKSIWRRIWEWITWVFGFGK